MAVRFDERAVARIEKAYRAPAIAEQRARTRAALGARAGERGLDVGCGPGFLAVELAREVGPTGRVSAVDPSPEMLAAATARVAAEGLAGRVEIRTGEATRLEFPTASFDFVAAVQVLLYVPSVEGALAEAARVLRPGGRLVVVDTDWDSCVWLTADRERHRRVLEAWGGHFPASHLPPRLPGLLRGAGLRLARTEAIPVVELDPAEPSYSAGIVDMAAEAALRHGVPSGEVDAWRADLRRRTGNGDYFFGVTRYLFLAEKPSG